MSIITTAFDLTFEEERNMNDPTTTFGRVAEQYRNNFMTKGDSKVNLYRWDTDLEFHNTKIISKAAQYHKQYGRYNDIDPKNEPLEWKMWWDREEYRRLKGITLPIGTRKGGGISDKDLINIWVPGKMYGQLNYGPINRTKDPDDIGVSIKDAIQEDIDIAERTNNEEKLKLLFKDLVVHEKGDSDYDFPDFWDGHFHMWVSQEFANMIGLDIIIFKARRKGMSYVGAWDAFDIFDLVPFSNTLLIAHDFKYLTAKDKLYDMVKTYSSFINKHTDWAKNKVKDTSMEMLSGYKFEGQNVAGFKSSVMAISAKDNPDCARGVKAAKIKWEECGTFPNLGATIESTSSASETGMYKVGQSTYWATIGSDEADYVDFAAYYYNPLAINCLCFDNIYDPGKKGTHCGMFFSHFQNYEGAMDVNGNTNFEKAERIHNEKRKIKKDNSSKHSFEKWDSERVTIPEVALMTKSNNIFSSYAKIFNENIQRIDRDPAYRNIADYGVYSLRGEVVQFTSNEELEALEQKTHPPLLDINKMLPDNHDMHGCIVEYGKPFMYAQKDNEGNIKMLVPPGIYSIWHDPYATDKDKEDIEMRDSVGAAYVYERINNITPTGGGRIVASWIGRPESTDEYNEQLYLLARRWNTYESLAFENDRGDVVSYFKRKDATQYLLFEPELEFLKNAQGRTGRNWGISIGKHPERKGHAARIFKDMLGWVITKDNETGEESIFAQYIPCKRLNRELLIWALKGNFDCVSAALVGGLTERQAIYDNVTDKANDEMDRQNEDFFNRDFFE